MDRKGRSSSIIGLLNQIKCDVEHIPQNFLEKFEKYLIDPKYSENEKGILNAAHYLATKWEFDIIYDMCRSYYGIDDTRREIDSKIDSFSDLEYFKTYQSDNNLKSFTALIGQLRFQQRWSRSPEYRLLRLFHICWSWLCCLTYVHVRLARRMKDA